MELGVHFALSDSVAAELLDARGDDDKLGALVEDIEETGRSEFSCDTDKAWDPILCALSSTGYERVSENWPAYGVILGDEDLNTDTDDQLVTYLATRSGRRSLLVPGGSHRIRVRRALTTQCHSTTATRSTAPTSAGTPGAGFRKWRTFSSARPESVATWYSPCGSDSREPTAEAARPRRMKDRLTVALNCGGPSARVPALTIPVPQRFWVTECVSFSQPD